LDNSKRALIDSSVSSVYKTFPFSQLSQSSFNEWVSTADIFRFGPGDVLLFPDEIPRHIFIILSGTVRILCHDPVDNGPCTVEKRSVGQILGWLSITRSTPSDWVTAFDDVLVLALSSEGFCNFLLNSHPFSSHFYTLSSNQEAFLLLSVFARNNDIHVTKSNLLPACRNTTVISLFSESNQDLPCDISSKFIFLLSTPTTSKTIGSLVDIEAIPSLISISRMPVRIVGIQSSVISSIINFQTIRSELISLPLAKTLSSGLDELGLIESSNAPKVADFPLRTSCKIPCDMLVATVEMLCIYSNVPYRSDTVKKVVSNILDRKNSLSLPLAAFIFEHLGFSTVISGVDLDNISKLTVPSVFIHESIPHIIISANSQSISLVDPINGISNFDSCAFIDYVTPLTDLTVLLPTRNSFTPTRTFGWSWFFPLLQKYKFSLLLVFFTALLTQIVGLAIPLLIQQIIDKVLSQGNTTSLNLLGTTMLILAFLQSTFTILQSIILVDTTDRMDLFLGSTVINKLLSLPLRYFESRTVGELSQRLGELNTIRSFLTGTTLITTLNIIFASLYILVMFLYSPLLSVIALSTVPIYIAIIYFASPIYKSFLRKRAVAQASTQSHLIEILSGIQTVKAQNFELSSRWKWQERYKQFIDQGFKSVLLSVTTSQVGSFLNQFSSLLILWVVLYLVLDAKLTLGQLIAFRIISSNVTGPLTQLSGLYQGFQNVQLSMERVADIVDQQSEIDFQETSAQIPLPPIQGHIVYQSVDFKFPKSNTNVLTDINIDIPAGAFVAIVGESGSGKSTFTKLLSRLYPIDSGKISIDGFDISKVDLTSIRQQIGIVPQDSLLFEGTIADNISLEDPSITPSELIQAATLACAHDFIMSLSDGYSTIIAERGANLSGGQRQRIAIARSVLSNPRLLIMDEATSALDYNTEKLLCQNLQKWSNGRTVLFVTHRLQSIINADLIIYMHSGRIVEFGTHQQLIGAQSRYYALFTQQS